LGVSGAKRYFTFVAQSLDNRSPDIISEFGRVLPSDDLRSPERTRVIGKTTTVSARGKQFRIADRSECRGFVLEQDVLFYVGTENKDESGRLAPVLCLGSFAEPDALVWREVLLGELDEFSKEAGRTVGPRQRSEFVQLIDLVLANRPGAAGASLQRRVAGAVNHLTRRDKVAARSTRDVSAALVVTAADKRVLTADTQLVGLLNNSNVAVVDIPVADDGPWADLAERLDELGLLESPTLALRDPYDADRYFRADDLSVELIRAKQSCYQILCKLLGARTVSVESVTKHTYTGGKRLKVGGSATIKGVGVKAKIAPEADDSKVTIQRVELQQENLGDLADIAAAEAFMRDRQLAWDRDLTHLIETVRYAHNPTKELHLSYSTSQAMDRVTRRVGNLAAFGAALGAIRTSRKGYETVYESKVSISF
jgi:hypothetical protein